MNKELNRYVKNYSVDGWPIADTKDGTLLSANDLLVRMNAYESELQSLRKALKDALHECEQGEK